MADDLARFEQALKAAAAAGDVEGARALATDMRRVMERAAGPIAQKPFPLGQEGMADAIKSEAAAFSPADQRLAGAGSAPMLALEGLKGMVGADDPATAQNWKAVSGATPQSAIGNMAGNVGMFAAMPPAAVGPAVLGLGGRALPRAGQVADMVGTQAGVAAATTPGDAGERLVAGLTGAAGGAAPAAVGAAQGTRRMASNAGRQLDVAEGLRREIGDTDQLVAALRDTAGYPTANIGVRPSSAMATRHPVLETMETGSRVRTGDQWTGFDRGNAQARWRALEAAAGTPEELARLRGARDAFTGPMRDEALGTMKGTFYHTGHKLENLDAALNNLATGTNRPNKDVQTMVNYVKGEIEQGASPEQLYTVRKMLTDGVAAGPTSDLSQAARAARPQRMEIIGEIDKALNDMSGGKWEKYLEAYKIASPQISSKGALQKITDSLMSGRAAGEVPASMGERAAPYTVGKLNERFGTKTFGSQEFDQLTPQHRRLMDSLIQDLYTQQGVMQPRGMLGSPTASNLANAGRVGQITNSMVDAAGSVIPYAGGAISASVKGGMARRSEETLAQMLQNPDFLAQALQDAARAQALLTTSGRAGAAGSAAKRNYTE